MSADVYPPAMESMEAARRTLDPAECALIVIDVQEKLLPAIFERDRVVKNSQLLVRAAGILNFPTIATTQYAKGLGETVADLKSLLPSNPIDKQMFSCFGSDVFCSMLKRLPGRRNTLLLCGMESHICVAQTRLRLCAKGTWSTLRRTR